MPLGRRKCADIDGVYTAVGDAIIKGPVDQLLPLDRSKPFKDLTNSDYVVVISLSLNVKLTIVKVVMQQLLDCGGINEASPEIGPRPGQSMAAGAGKSAPF